MLFRSTVSSATNALSYLKKSAGTMSSLKKEGIGGSVVSVASTAIQPLIAMAKTSETYQKVAKIQSKVSPILNMAARASGAWASPGNAGEISQKLLYTAESTLIQIILITLMSLKDWVWNLEFSIPVSESSVTTYINKAIASAAIANSSIISAASTNISGNSYVGIDSSDDSIKYIELDFEKTLEMDYAVEGSTYKRLIGLGYNNNGIWYSDDGGTNWSHSTINSIYTYGSWSCVCCYDNIIIVGGYTPNKETETELYSSDGINFYSDSAMTVSVNINNIVGNSYSKYNEGNNKYLIKTVNSSKGIYYSSDYGVTYNTTSVTSGDFIDIYALTDGTTTRATAYSVDNKGILYSDDFINWNSSNIIKNNFIGVSKI